MKDLLYAHYKRVRMHCDYKFPKANALREEGEGSLFLTFNSENEPTSF